MNFAFFSSAPSSRWRPRPRHAGLTWGALALSAGFVAASVGLAGSRQVFALLRDVDTRWLGAAFAVAFVQLGLLGLRWSRIARELGIELGWLQATTEYALSLLGNQVLPSGFAGDGLRGVRQARTSEHGYWATFEALALDRTSGQLGLWLIVLVTAPLSVRAGILSGEELGVIALCTAGACGLLWWVTFRLAALDRLMHRVRPALQRASSLLFSRRAAAHLPLSLALVIASTLQLFIAARALGIMLPWLELMWLGPLVLVAASVPSFFGGWGIREGASAVLFAAAGMPDSAGVAVSVVYGAFALVTSLPAVVVLLVDTSAARASGESPWLYANAASMIVGSLLAATIGYPPLVGFVAGFCCFVLVARDEGMWTPGGRFGAPNLITTGRLLMTLGLLFAYGRQPGWQLAVAAGVILALDVVDGWVARRTGQSSAFGASYDVEADALLVTTIAMLLYIRGTAGAWVLLAGLLRYAYVLAPAIVPTPVGQAPRSRHGRVVYVTMLRSFMLALVAGGAGGRALALLGTVVLTLSFSHSFWQRYVSPSAA
jgi:phosphatidylglycerophosphate synthase/uncharacterized membrane protein YbhN (UPF0104 family)